MGNVAQRSPVPKESNNQCQDKTRNGFRSKILKLRSRSFRKTHRGDWIPVKSNGNFPSQHHSYLTPDEIRNIQVRYHSCAYSVMVTKCNIRIKSVIILLRFFFV